MARWALQFTSPSMLAGRPGTGIQWHRVRTGTASGNQSGRRKIDQLVSAIIIRSSLLVLPRNPSGKTIYQELRAPFWSMADRHVA